jgi:hypothetical protein
MYKIVFSSDDLPPGLDDEARFSAWRDFFANVNGPLEVTRLPDRPFSQRMEAARFDSVRVMRLRGSTDRIWWRSPYGAARRSPDAPLAGSTKSLTSIAASVVGSAPRRRSFAARVTSCAECYMGAGVTSGLSREGKDDHSDLEGGHGRPLV